MASPRLYFAEIDKGRSAHELAAAVAAAGVQVTVVDALVAPLPGLPPLEELPETVRPVLRFREDDCFSMAEAVGAEIVNLAHVMGRPVAADEMARAVAGIARRAARRGLKLSIEFMPNSAAIPSLRSALELVARAGEPNVGVMLDTWHLFRAGEEPGTVAGTPPGAILGVQVADAPADARGRPPLPMQDRLLPGEGGMPLRDILAAVLAGSPEALIGAEVISGRLAELAPVEAARQAADALAGVLPDG
jgi:sugar phosphate isomerase/epimerase